MAQQQESITYDSLTLALELFLAAKQAQGCTATTRQTYERMLTRFLDWLRMHGVVTPECITPTHIRQYLAELTQLGLKQGTVHDYARPVKTWLRFLARDGVIPSNPFAVVVMPRLSKEPLPALTPDQVRRLLEACDHERDTAIILCLLDSGLRAAEFVALNVDDVDRVTGGVVVRSGKGRKARVAYIGARARRALTRYLIGRGAVAAHAPLWASLTTGARLTTWGLRLVLERVGERAGVKCSAHMFRRSFALWALRSGMDLARLAVLLGHADLQVVRRYLALVTDDLRAAHEQHGPVDTLLKDGKRWTGH
jgi:site-specific recombinase XerD